MGASPIRLGVSTCGMQHVKRYDADDHVHEVGTGMFTATLMRIYPEMPVIEEPDLEDETKRQAFIEKLSNL